MINLEFKTKLPQKEVLERLKRFFGKGGLGLEIKDENPQCFHFEGGGGYITATVCPDGKETRITLLSQEWEGQVKKFASEFS